MEQHFSDLIILLASGINQRRLYFDDHPKVQAFSRDFITKLNRLVAENPDEPFTFGVYKGKFVRHGNYLVGPSIAGRSLISFAEKLGCGGFSFNPPLEPENIIAFFRLAATTKEPFSDLDTARRLFVAEGLDRIVLANPFTEGKGGKIEEGERPVPNRESESEYTVDDFSSLVDIYQGLYEIVSHNNLHASRDGNIDVVGALTTGEKLVSATSNGVMDVMQFIRYPDYDSYTIGHSVRVGALSVVVGQRLGLDQEILTELATAGLLHDLGKGRIPEEILFKPGKLDPRERKIMESHPTLGAQVLIASGEADEIMISAAWGHHIRQDGRGYPPMPEWYRPCFATAIIHVCDVFEALTAARPYKKPLAPRHAYEIMFKDRGAFDPRPLAALVQALGLYPPGSEVVLTDGSRGVVAHSGNDLDKPAVRITHDQLGRQLASGTGQYVDLAREGELGIADILLVGTGGS